MPGPTSILAHSPSRSHPPAHSPTQPPLLPPPPPILPQALLALCLWSCANSLGRKDGMGGRAAGRTGGRAAGRRGRQGWLLSSRRLGRCSFSDLSVHRLSLAEEREVRDDFPRWCSGVMWEDLAASASPFYWPRFYFVSGAVAVRRRDRVMLGHLECQPS